MPTPHSHRHTTHPPSIFKTLIINRIPTDVLYLPPLNLHPSPSPSPTTVHVLVIPGNPGSCQFYKSLLYKLRHSLSSSSDSKVGEVYHFHCISYSSHGCNERTTTSPILHDDHGVNTEDINNNNYGDVDNDGDDDDDDDDDDSINEHYSKTSFTVDGQAEHKACYINTLLTPNTNNDKYILIGHSIGCALIHSILYNRLTPPSKCLQVIELMPFTTYAPPFPQRVLLNSFVGSSESKLRRLAGFTGGIARILPKWLMLLILRNNIQEDSYDDHVNETHASTKTVKLSYDLMTTPGYPLNFCRLALDEINNVSRVPLEREHYLSLEKLCNPSHDDDDSESDSDDDYDDNDNYRTSLLFCGNNDIWATFPLVTGTIKALGSSRYDTGKFDDKYEGRVYEPNDTPSPSPSPSHWQSQSLDAGENKPNVFISYNASCRHDFPAGGTDGINRVVDFVCNEIVERRGCGDFIEGKNERQRERARMEMEGGAIRSKL